jgi:plasmid stabilization system protein ParE
VTKLIWSPNALEDVQQLYRFLATQNNAPASRAIRAIRLGVKILSHHPQIGRPVNDMDPEFREWLIDFGNSGYVALYHFDGETAIILAVRHQKEVGY